MPETTNKTVFVWALPNRQMLRRMVLLVTTVIKPEYATWFVDEEEAFQFKADNVLDISRCISPKEFTELRLATVEFTTVFKFVLGDPA